MQSISVPTETHLSVTCQLYERRDSDTGTTAIVHGACHTPHCFSGLAHALNDLDIDCALIGLQSEFSGRMRNFIGMAEYQQGLLDALKHLQMTMYKTIESIAGHSMGGRLVQRIQETGAYTSVPTIFMAPIPLHGTGPMLLNTMKRHPWMLAQTLGGELRTAMRSDQEIRTLFGDINTPPEVVETIRKQLNHTSYRAYLELLGRQHIAQNSRPTLLLQSITDGLFPPGSYDGMNTRYTKLTTQTIPGGHDFFIQHPRETASTYAAFHREHVL